MHIGMRLLCVLGLLGQVTMAQGQASGAGSKQVVGDAMKSKPPAPAFAATAAPASPAKVPIATKVAPNPDGELSQSVAPSASSPASPGSGNSAGPGPMGQPPEAQPAPRAPTRERMATQRTLDKASTASRSVPAVPGRAVVALIVGILGRRDEGFARIGEGLSAGQIGVQASYDVYANAEFRLAVEAGWGVSGGQGSALLGGEVTGEYSEHRMLGGLVLSGLLLESVWPHLRIGGGVSALSVELREESGTSGFSIDDRAWLPVGEVALGTTVLFPMGKRWKFSLQVRGEIGYGFSRRESMTLSTASVSSTAAQQIRTSDLGSLHVTGAFGRVAFGIRM